MDVVPALRAWLRQIIDTPRRKCTSLLISLTVLAFAASLAHAETQIPVESLPSASSGVKAQEQVDGATGSFTQTIPIEVPSFFGIEPKLSLSYDWKGGNGPLGMGWRVDGLSVIQRASPGRGVPTYDSSDVYLLDGQELAPCGQTGTANASCSASGTHTTKIESLVRVTRNGSANWILRARDGTRLTYLPLDDEQDYRWRLSTVADTHGNTVTYNYACPAVPDLPNQPNIPPFIFNSNEPECYIDTISYNQTTVTFYREQRPDIFTYNRGAGLVQVSSRFKTITVETAGLKVRAYKFLYNFVSAGTQRRRLASVQQFGRDYTLSATNSVDGGTSLPPVTLTYTGAATSFQLDPLGNRAGRLRGGQRLGHRRLQRRRQDRFRQEERDQLQDPGAAVQRERLSQSAMDGDACLRHRLPAHF